MLTYRQFTRFKVFLNGSLGNLSFFQVSQLASDFSQQHNWYLFFRQFIFFNKSVTQQSLLLIYTWGERAYWICPVSWCCWRIWVVHFLSFPVRWNVSSCPRISCFFFPSPFSQLMSEDVFLQDAIFISNSTSEEITSTNAPKIIKCTYFYLYFWSLLVVTSCITTNFKIYVRCFFFVRLLKIKIQEGDISFPMKLSWHTWSLRLEANSLCSQNLTKWILTEVI